MSFGWDLETVVLAIGSEGSVAARFFECSLCLLVKHIADAFIEQEREDELLVVAGVNGPAQKRRRAPQVGFELLL